MGNKYGWQQKPLYIVLFKANLNYHTPISDSEMLVDIERMPLTLYVTLGHIFKCVLILNHEATLLSLSVLEKNLLPDPKLREYYVNYIFL